MIMKEEDLQNKLVFVNGKRVAADIEQLDTAAGWVDIVLPILGKAVMISSTDTKVVKDAEPKSKLTTRRLVGTVEVRDAANPRRN